MNNDLRPRVLAFYNQNQALFDAGVYSNELLEAICVVENYDNHLLTSRHGKMLLALGLATEAELDEFANLSDEQAEELFSLAR